MDLSTSILGKSVVDRLAESHHSAVLRVGSDTFTRRQLSRVECFNFPAAKNLTDLIADLNIKNLQTLFDSVPPSALALPRLGAVSLAVLGAAFQAKGIGGKSPLLAWVRHHAAKGEKETTFASMKERLAAEHQKESKERRRRKHARRNQAHSIRTNRYIHREGATLQ